MDSTVLLHHLVSRGDQVRALSVDYGQRHHKELEYALRTAEALHVPLIQIPLGVLRHVLPGSSQTDVNVRVPEGHYAEENMKLTVVPNRNMILLSIAIGHAVAHKFDAVAYAAHAGDHAVYPDCREEFVKALESAAALCDWHVVQLERPFVRKSKADLVALGSALEVDFRQTWSCYAGRELHCGKCGTCVERILAFKEAGVPDPTEYEEGGVEFALSVQAPGAAV